MDLHRKIGGILKKITGIEAGDGLRFFERATGNAPWVEVTTGGAR